MFVKKNISLKSYNTFGIDARAQFLLEIESDEQLRAAYQSSEFRALPKLVLGGGSNILFTKNQRKAILKINIRGIEVLDQKGHEVRVKVGAGEAWHQFVLWCLDHDFGGVENLSLIPGTVGAAPIQNIGAYGVELKDVFESLEAYEIKSGKIRSFNKEQCQFDYRHSFFKGRGKDQFVIISVTFKLTTQPIFNVSYGGIQQRIDEEELELNIRNISESVIHIRQIKLPDPIKIGNAGSFFKNPIIEKPLYDALSLIYEDLPHYPVDSGSIKIPAAWLIEQCGWKGKRMDQIGVHERQPLVLVNYGEGKGIEILKLSEQIQSSIQKKFGIELAREINVF